MKLKINSGVLLIAFTATAFFMTSCKKEMANVQAATDSTKAIASYDPAVSFTNFKTIAVADSVQVYKGGVVSNELTGTEDLFRQTFIDSLTARGFTIVGLSGNPDLVLNLTHITATSTGIADKQGFWNNYASVYDPALYGEPGIPYAENFTTAAAVNDGILSFELLDLKDAASAGSVNVVWNGMVSGAQQFSSNGMANTESGVLFVKSPYLRNQ
jgi:hypothetical protein